MPVKLFLGVLLACFSLAVHAASIDGPATAIDGDTIEVHAGDKFVRVRLCGIDSPELRHAGGPEAATKMRGLLSNPVHCVPVGEGTPCDGRSKPTNHNRIVAQCFINGSDISKEMVCSGHAIDWPKFSDGYYRCGNRKIQM